MLCKNELWQAENGTTVFKIFYEEGYQYQLRCKKTFSYFFFSQIIPKMNDAKNPSSAWFEFVEILKTGSNKSYYWENLYNFILNRLKRSLCQSHQLLTRKREKWLKKYTRLCIDIL